MMRVAVLSDIHANLTALDAVVASIPSVDEVWHLVKPHDDSRNWAIAGIEQLS